MLRLGRPRKSIKDLPLGVYPVKGRYYVRPVNAEMREIFAVVYPGRRCAPLGADKGEARKLWVKLFATDRPPESPTAGTLNEIIGRYEREIIPTLTKRTGPEHKRYCRNLRAWCGNWRYAKSEAEASTGKYLRSIDVTQYLRAQMKVQVFNKQGTLISDGRKVAANKEVQCMSRMFRLAKTLWGYTEYNPCLQVEYNSENERDIYIDDDMFMKVYAKASPTMKCMMDLAQMNGSRRGMIIRLMLSDITDEGVWFTVNKRNQNQGKKRKLATWTDDLRDVIKRAKEIRAKLRGGQKVIVDHTTAPLFLTRYGKAFTETAFNRQWSTARKAGGFGKHEFHFHDVKAKSLSDSPDEIDAMNRGDHVELRTTRRVYRRKPNEVIPLQMTSRNPT